MLLGVDFSKENVFNCPFSDSINAAMSAGARGVIFAGKTPRRCPTNEKQTIPGVAVTKSEAQLLYRRLEMNGTVMAQINVYDDPCKDVLR